MGKEINDNQKDKDIEETEVEETEEEDTEVEADDSEDEETEEESEETEDEEDSEEESEEDSEDDEKEEEDEDENIPDKFKGKSKSEIVASYLELEQLLGKRPISKAERAELKKAGVSREDIENMEDLAKELEQMDFTKMSPAQFGIELIKIIDKRTESRAREVYEQSSTIKTQVQSEISEAQEKYPMLKANKEYRGLVLAVIEAGAAKGEVVPLIKACEKVNAIIGEQKKKKDDKDRKDKVKRTVVERTPSGGDSGKETEEDRIKRGMLAGTKSALGGLGV